MVKKIADSGQDIGLGTMIKAICARPKMYAGNSNFLTVAAFIDGFAYGSEKRHDELRKFNVWLSGKLKFSPNVAWWSGLLHEYPNSEDALQKLPGLFDEFSGKKNRSSDSMQQ
jgi:hypothetical protein